MGLEQQNLYNLRKYAHDHEYLYVTWLRRADMRDLGPSIKCLHRLQSYLYQVPAFLGAWAEDTFLNRLFILPYVLGTIGKLCEKAVREYFDSGPEAATSAIMLYNFCEPITNQWTKETIEEKRDYLDGYSRWIMDENSQKPYFLQDPITSDQSLETIQNRFLNESFIGL